MFMATTPYRKLQERVKELEDISKGHKAFVGKLCTELNDVQDKLADAQTTINLLKDRLDTTEEPLRQLCYIIKVSNYFENIRATQMKQARDIVDINYVP
jgi:chromosome segregation ATPase